MFLLSCQLTLIEELAPDGLIVREACVRASLHVPTVLLELILLPTEVLQWHLLRLRNLRFLPGSPPDGHLWGLGHLLLTELVVLVVVPAAATSPGKTSALVRIVVTVLRWGLLVLDLSLCELDLIFGDGLRILLGYHSLHR